MTTIITTTSGHMYRVTRPARSATGLPRLFGVRVFPDGADIPHEPGERFMGIECVVSMTFASPAATEGTPA